jgi:hypothetical protein
MNHHTRNGLIGLVATVIPNLTLRLLFPEIFPAPFTGSWWYMWFPLYVLWLGFLVIGLAGHAAKDGNRGGERDTGGN